MKNSMVPSDPLLPYSHSRRQNLVSQWHMHELQGYKVRLLPSDCTAMRPVYPYSELNKHTDSRLILDTHIRFGKEEHQCPKQSSTFLQAKKLN